MSSHSDPGSVSFAETRKAVLDAFEHLEAQAREREAEIIRRAEERAGEIVAQAEERVAELDRQLAKLREDVDSARAALAVIRRRGTEPEPSPLVPANTAPMPATPEPLETPPEPPAARPFQDTTAPTSVPSWSDVHAQVESQPQSASDQPGSTSPQETLRALRAALEALNRPREGE